jgi:hypothetical protein
LATHEEMEGDVFDRTSVSLFQLLGLIKGCNRSLNAIRSRRGARGTDREAAELKLNAVEMRRTARLLDECAAEVAVVVQRKK